jgi:hypothetical protein
MNITTVRNSIILKTKTKCKGNVWLKLLLYLLLQRNIYKLT